MTDITDSLQEAMKITGAVATALVDFESGLTLGTLKVGDFDIEVAAAGNTQVVRSKMMVMNQLGIHGGIEDILITLTNQYHLIRILSSNPTLFMYLALDRATSNLGLARHKLKAIESTIQV